MSKGTDDTWGAAGAGGGGGGGQMPSTCLVSPRVPVPFFVCSLEPALLRGRAGRSATLAANGSCTLLHIFSQEAAKLGGGGPVWLPGN